MAFSDFKSVAAVQEAYHIVYQEADFLQFRRYTPSSTIRSELAFNRQYIEVLSSEASRCENIIYPILREVYKAFIDRYALWSHKALTYDQTLDGTPDYLITTKSELGKTVMGIPIVVIVEAKQNNFTEGWGQCLAELVAAQKLNQDEQKPIYGLVTDAEVWQFGKLHAGIFTKHRTHLTLDDLQKLCGALIYCLEETHATSGSPADDSSPVISH